MIFMTVKDIGSIWTFSPTLPTYPCYSIQMVWPFRFLRQHMLLLAIFYSKEKPVINMFLRPVIDDINMVYRGV